MGSLKEAIGQSMERIVTGLVLLVVAIGVAVVDSPFVMWCVLGLVYLISFYEASKLFDVNENKLYLLALLLWCVAGFYPTPDGLIFIVLMFLVALMVHQKNLQTKYLSLFFYPTASMLALLALYKSYGMGYFAWLILLVALTDTGAYFVGKSLGKTPFSPTSPNKTWEGVAGGIFIATFVGAIGGVLLVPFWSAVCISLSVSAFSVWGDLFESYLKREAGVKDSGSIFPGHGGMLDRMDGYLFGGVVMLVLLRGLL